MEVEQKILDRVRRLLAMTPDRGCTEAEAMVAAAKAAELMREYGLCVDDLVMSEEGAKSATGLRGAKGRLWAVIARCTNTACTTVRQKGYREVRFYGREPGPQIAVYLRTVCDRAVDREIALFKRSSFYRQRRNLSTRRKAVADFTDALTLRLSFRLLELFEAAMDEVAWKDARKGRDARYPDVGEVKPVARKERFYQAGMAGHVAGGKVPLSQGLASGQPDVALIGGVA